MDIAVIGGAFEIGLNSIFNVILIKNNVFWGNVGDLPNNPKKRLFSREPLESGFWFKFNSSQTATNFY